MNKNNIAPNNIRITLRKIAYKFISYSLTIPSRPNFPNITYTAYRIS